MISERDMMLARDWRGEVSLIGFDASRKHNGCHLWFDGDGTRKLFSRSGNVVDCPDCFTADLPNMALEMECEAGLGVGRNSANSAFNVAQNAVRLGGAWFFKTDKGNPIRFAVFDAPKEVGNWRARMIIAAAATQGCRSAYPVEITRIESPKHLAEFMINLRNIGAEGGMFQDPSEIGYRPGRNGAWRWKF